MTIDNARLLAFYLPQFHPIPENDAWWGKGFTEWRNVVKARPLFDGHYQPHLPADLGLYDLRVAETRVAQAALARAYGVYGFCYYHYWFRGRQLLERPVREMLAAGAPDFPFCLCWANETWSRTWDGAEASILMKQEYCDEDHRNHVRHLAAYFRDQRYIRVNGKPLFIFYRPTKISNVERAIEIWREEARRAGIGDLYLCGIDAIVAEEPPVRPGILDALVEFAPDWGVLPPVLGRTRQERWLTKLGLKNRAFQEHRVYSYQALRDAMLAKPIPNNTYYRCVTPSWDNSPRRLKDATIFIGSTPELYEEWLRKLVQSFRPPSSEENIVFINGWNEWAEGNHLEPCQKWDKAYLEATARALGHSAEAIKNSD